MTEGKKLFVNSIIKRVDVYRDYELDIEMMKRDRTSIQSKSATQYHVLKL